MKSVGVSIAGVKSLYAWLCYQIFLNKISNYVQVSLKGWKKKGIDLEDGELLCR